MSYPCTDCIILKQCNEIVLCPIFIKFKSKNHWGIHTRNCEINNRCPFCGEKLNSKFNCENCTYTQYNSYIQEMREDNIPNDKLPM